MQDPSLLLLAALLAGVIYLWQRSLRAREFATRLAIDTCEQQGLQFLDGTVAIQRLRLRRLASGRLALERTYQFEYTEDRQQRLKGFVILLGLQLEAVGLAAERTSKDTLP